MKKIKNDEEFEIMGHKFHGLEDLEKSVEVVTRITNSIGDRYIRRGNPEQPVEGLHVLKLYEPYPCFDSEDYLYENRKYANYFFSSKPFSDEDIEKIAGLPCQFDYCMVTETVPREYLPAIYFGGSSYHELVIAD